VGYNNPSIPWSELEQRLSGGALRSERLFNEAKFSKVFEEKVSGKLRPDDRPGLTAALEGPDRRVRSKIDIVSAWMQFVP